MTRIFLRIIVLVAGLFMMAGASSAFERDVHFGLTKWLAMQAGFDERPAESIAIGDARVDSGDLQYVDLVTVYACLAKDADAAKDAAKRHYPTAGKIPGPPEQRAVAAGGDPVRQRVEAATKVKEQQAGFLLYKLGEALHALQDSWAHQGVTEPPHPFEGAMTCDPQFGWGHPRARGGWNSHKADLTSSWGADTMAMAKATFDALKQYPQIGTAPREPKDWKALALDIDAFMRASTKAQKKKWFVEHGITDVSFLEGISLPDGTESFNVQWPSHKLPPLNIVESTQHHVDEKLLAFFSKFFADWLQSDNLDAVAAEFAAAAPPAGANPFLVMSKPELLARLQVWRIRDHGRVADMAHSLQPLTAQQRSSIASLAKGRDALARFPSLNEAYVPLLVKGPEPSPLLGFIIHPVAKSAAGNERVVATSKLRHLPYDTIVVMAEKMDGRWRIVSISATVDH